MRCLCFSEIGEQDLPEAMTHRRIEERPLEIEDRPDTVPSEFARLLGAGGKYQLRLGNPVYGFVEAVRGLDEELYRVCGGEVLYVLDLELSQPKLDVRIDAENGVQGNFLAELLRLGAHAAHLKIGEARHQPLKH